MIEKNYHFSIKALKDIYINHNAEKSLFILAKTVTELNTLLCAFEGYVDWSLFLVTTPPYLLHWTIKLYRSKNRYKFCRQSFLSSMGYVSLLLLWYVGERHRGYSAQRTRLNSLKRLFTNLVYLNLLFIFLEETFFMKSQLRKKI